ncbi:universal stress protein [Methylocystis sp.]|uniref:universal stress protein n=1 Tax=Methylocystis sp. TaxID=1911079 RepID=UPI002736B8B2|nr:universal stress protein [Methylocystis sp.]MDP3554024.1 universal stress protein [Methylocystis sp.]
MDLQNITHILAATDFSDTSISALERGFLIAKAAGARYSVVHAVDDGALTSLRRLFDETFDPFPKDAKEKAREQLEKVVSGASQDCGLCAELRLENGSAWAAVCSLADTTDAGLIVVGAHGGGFLSRPTIGSTVSRILHQSRQPVLIVKRRPGQAYQRVLVAADFSPVSTATVRLARTIAPEAEIILMHAFEEPLYEELLEYDGDGEHIVDRYRERAHRELQELAAASGLSASQFSALVVRGNAKRAIVAHANQLRCDLIVMGKHGSGGIDELLLGSVANQVVIDAESDILIVVDAREPELWCYTEDRRAKTKLLQSDRFDISAWGVGRAGSLKTLVAGEVGEEIVEALREAFAKADVCEINWGATLTHEDVEARPVDLVMTLPFSSGGDAWEGPVLLISLENAVQEQIDKFDASGGSEPSPDELITLRNGLHMLANRLNKARIRNAAKIARREEHKAPLF